MTLCRRLFGAGEGPLCSCGRLACVLAEEPPDWIPYPGYEERYVPAPGSPWEVCGVGLAVQFAAVEGGGWPRPDGVVDWCPACGTSRRNLCRFDADASVGLRPPDGGRPGGCLSNDPPLATRPEAADPPSFQRYPPRLGTVAVLVLAAIPVLAVLVVLWGKSR